MRPLERLSSKNGSHEPTYADVALFDALKEAREFCKLLDEEVSISIRPSGQDGEIAYMAWSSGGTIDTYAAFENEKDNRC